MELFVQAAAATLVASVMGLTLNKQGKDMGVLLVVAVSCMVVGIAVSYLKPVLGLLKELEKLGNMDSNMTGILFKVAGIGLLSEIAALICTDAGNGSVGKSLQILGTAVILWLAIPIFSELIELVKRILEGV